MSADPDKIHRNKGYQGRFYTSHEVEAMIEKALLETCIVIKHQNFDWTAKRTLKRYGKSPPTFTDELRKAAVRYSSGIECFNCRCGNWVWIPNEYQDGVVCPAPYCERKWKRVISDENRVEAVLVA